MKTKRKKKAKKRGGRRIGAGRPRLEQQEQIRAGASSVARIAATAEKHGLNKRHAADMLIELGYVYDSEYSGSVEAPPAQVRARLSDVAARVRALQEQDA